jgi:site-specific recombinase XerD
MKIKRNTKELATLMNDWLKIYLPNIRFRSMNTVNAYESALSLFLDFLEDKKQISVSTLSEECFRREWIEEWISFIHTDKHNSKRTCDMRLSCIRSLLKYLSSKNVLFLPYYLDACGIDKLMRGHAKQVEGISKHAMTELFAAIQGNDKTVCRDRIFFTVMYDTGARVSEILNIRIRDLKLDDKTPYVIITGKGGKPRTLLFSSNTVIMLVSFIKENFGEHPFADGFLFYSRVKGRSVPVSVDAINSRLKVYAKAAHGICPEIPIDLHTHQIRHSACTHWYQDNINIAKISRYLGHKSIETTMTYLGISKEELAEALAKRESVVANNESTYNSVKGGLRSLIDR